MATFGLLFLVVVFIIIPAISTLNIDWSGERKQRREMIQRIKDHYNGDYEAAVESYKANGFTLDITVLEWINN